MQCKNILVFVSQMIESPCFIYQTEMASLKADNDRLNRVLHHHPAAVGVNNSSSSSSSVPATPCTTAEPIDKRLSLGDPTKFGK